MNLDPPLFNAAVLDIDNLPQAHRVLILAYRAADHHHGVLLELFVKHGVTQMVGLGGDLQLGGIHVEGQLALHLDAGTLRLLKNLLADHLRVIQTQPLADLQGRRLSHTLLSGDTHGQQDGAVGAPLHLGLEGLSVQILPHLVHTDVHVVFLIQLVDVDDLAAVLKRAAANQGGGVGRIAAVLLHVVVAVVGSDGGHVVLGPLKDVAVAHAALNLAGDAVAVALGVLGGVHEEALLNGVEVAADLHDLLHEQTGALLELTGHLAQRAILFELHHLHQAVQTDEGLLGVVDGLDIVDVPGDVAALVRGDGGLDVRAGQL